MKQKYIFSILFIFLYSVSLPAQEYDESFLKSLPDSVTKGLLEKAGDQEDLEEIQYRRPSTFIKKPEKDSLRFGIEIFSMMQTTLMPINEPNFNGNYVLDFGDVLELQLVGQKSSTKKYAISRDGSINVKDIGKIFISGLSLDNAVDLIKAKVNSLFIGVDAFISLINVRDIQIIVAGNAYNPGPYILNGNSTLFHALSVSGGPSEIGSFRSINILRDNEIIETVDLYNTLMLGKSNFGARLKSGDLIFINPVMNLVTVEGAVKRPGVYELKEDEQLSTAILFSNGVNNMADMTDISLHRINNGSADIIKLDGVKALRELNSKDADKISIREYPFRSVEINGAVKNPGTYIINEGDGILGLVNKAGGYLDNAYPFGGILESEITRDMNKLALEKLYKSFIDTLLLISSNTGSQNISGNSSVMILLDELKNAPVSGRVSAEFDLNLLELDRNNDILLQEGDSITIPELLDHVYVYGEVSSAGTTKYDHGKDYQQYISSKGGYTEYANKKEIFVLHPNGETYKLSRRTLFESNKNSNMIYPGSVIYIPRKMDSFYSRSQTVQAYAAILGNLGISLASLSVLKD